MSKFTGIMASLVACVLSYFFLFNHIGIQQIGIAYDSWNGNVTIQKTGWHITGPQVQVATVSTLPIQVCLNSGARVLNCKLIRFKEEGVQEFIREQGFHYYESASSSSQNGCTQGCIGIANILKGYAYSGKAWPFLEIIEEIAPHGTPAP